jgi:hypothetical protein
VTAMTPRSSYAALAEALLARVQEAPLLPVAAHDAQLTARIDELRVAAVVRGVLHMLNDDLPSAHAIAQSEDGEMTFDYLHAIVHRREGDYGNAKYWYGRVVAHPVLEQVHGRDPAEALRFVDRCRRAGDRRDVELRSVQAHELSALLDYAATRQPAPAQPAPAP